MWEMGEQGRSHGGLSGGAGEVVVVGGVKDGQHAHGVHGADLLHTLRLRARVRRETRERGAHAGAVRLCMCAKVHACERGRVQRCTGMHAHAHDEANVQRGMCSTACALGLHRAEGYACGQHSAEGRHNASAGGTVKRAVPTAGTSLQSGQHRGLRMRLHVAPFSRELHLATGHHVHRHGCCMR